MTPRRPALSRTPFGATATALVALVALAAGCNKSDAAEKIDPATLYEVSTQGTSSQLKAGEKGKFVLTIQSKPGAYVSSEAPLKLELSGEKATFDKQKLTLQDSVNPAASGQKAVAPRFEVPFLATASGPLQANLTFFVCTETLCVRQQKKLDVSVEVR